MGIFSFFKPKFRQDIDEHAGLIEAELEKGNTDEALRWFAELKRMRAEIAETIRRLSQKPALALKSGSFARGEKERLLDTGELDREQQKLKYIDNAIRNVEAKLQAKGVKP